MIELVYKEKTPLKKGLYFCACLAIPYISYIGYYEAAIYLLFAYIAIVFYEADHYNIRFIIVMVAIEEMLSQISGDCLKLFTRVVFPVSDFSGEIFATYMIQGFLALLMCLAIVNRGRIIDWYNGKTNSQRRYRLIGMEWLIIIAYFFVFVIHIIFLIFVFESIVEVSSFDTNLQWYRDPETLKYLMQYEKVYFLESAFLMFAIQSYNYKRCRRTWAVRF